MEAINNRHIWLSIGSKVGVGSSPAKAVSKEDVVDMGEDFFGLGRGKLRTRFKGTNVENTAKHMTRAMIDDHFDVSRREIGELVCKTDHSTACTSSGVHNGAMKVDKSYQRQYAEFGKYCHERGLVDNRTKYRHEH